MTFPISTARFLVVGVEMFKNQSCRLVTASVVQTLVLGGGLEFALALRPVFKIGL